jgi:hypothetical protein
MSIFRPKGRTVYYAGFGAGGRYFVRTTGTASRRKAEREERRLRELAEQGRLPTPSPEERAESIKRSLAVREVKRRHAAKNREAAERRARDPKSKRAWLDSIRAGQSVPDVRDAMRAANDRTAKDPSSQRKKSKSLKRVWRRPGHRPRVRGSMAAKWRDPGWRAKNIAGREKNAIARLQAKGLQLATARPKKPRGRPATKGAFYREMAALYEAGGHSFRSLARERDPDFSKSPKLSEDRMRLGTKPYRRNGAIVRRGN